ncbi:MAG TPA: alanine--glyoxylate aminotransferase family protein [Pseudogracilibacillus sp.]|nr:alanine--glyoxylate aminotransferase family protein [Pseudogracilibacillus sp.]
MINESNILRIPGPSPIPPSVQRAMSQPMIGHRGQETSEMMQRIKPELKKVFGTKQDVMIITGSGTSGLETAAVNVASAGDEVLVLVSGSFGDRFAKICETYEMKTHRIEVDWGENIVVDDVAEFLKENKNIKAVFMTQCETSTGILNPVEEISKAIQDNSDALIVVDGVSCVGGVVTEMDAWGVDVFVTGSQKAMMLPAGLTFIAVSDKAWKAIDDNKEPRFYLDLRRYRDNLDKDTTPFTPALSLIFGLEQALNLLNEEGLDNVYARHTLMKDMTRAAMKALNVPLLTDDDVASATVTAVKPDSFDPEALRKSVKAKFGLALAGGQAHLKGEIFRIGHMGYCTPADVLQYIGIIELGISDIGAEVELGAGVRAAQEVYLKQNN